jgi:hypothetical protein
VSGAPHSALSRPQAQAAQPPAAAARAAERAAPALRRLGARLRAHPREKTVLLLGLSVGICVPYFLLQRLEGQVSPARLATPLDAWIAFEPAWVWAYLSIAVLVPLFPLLARRREELRRFARGLALLCALSFASFLLFPVVGPRPAAVPDHALYAWLVARDGALNSFPSLHAGLTAYTLLFGWRILREGRSQRERLAHACAAALWAALILYGTLATKQHWAADLPPGLLAGWLAHHFAWREARAPSSAARRAP